MIEGEPAGRSPPAPSVVRVLPKVAALEHGFDYLVPERWKGEAGLGAMVRVALHGRRVDGWVVEEDPTPPPGVALRPLLRVRGRGPDREMMALARWGAWRWAGPLSRFLTAASPERMVPVRMGPAGAEASPDGSREDGARRPPPVTGAREPMAEEALGLERAVVRLAPTSDPWPFVLAAARRGTERGGSALVLCPGEGQAEALAGRLSSEGLGVALPPAGWAAAAAGGRVVLGTRKAAWAPAPRLSAVVVLDAHDRSFEEESAPTWDAWVVAAERARRAGAPCVLVSACPTVEQLAWGRLVLASRRAERSGWPALWVLDRRAEDPRSGLFSPRLVPLVREAGPGPARVLCVLNRTGRAALLACAACGELYRCERCGQALARVSGDQARCRRCGEARPAVCASCGSVRQRSLRPGVSRVREELEALAGRPVEEVTAASAAREGPLGPLVVGTEALLHRANGARAVVFLDFDQEMLVGRLRAGEEALALLARAARLVGEREAGGRLVVQTRVPGHPVLLSALHADPGRLAETEVSTRQALQMAPPVALALASGAGAASFVEELRAGEATEVEV
ncbi:MAG: hypothetical protein J2P59_07650, partial [Acidimicrobiales bacterium]|nr:hypothetical protein [Acidimicrobiales bacterium]